MLFGSIEGVFTVVQGSTEAAGGSLGGLLGTGTGSSLGLISRVFETIYAASGAGGIPPIGT